MFESILTISIAGFLAGFIFAMPIAGPVSILVTTNALKGRVRYCTLVSLGASISDFLYVFIAVFGLTRLYSFYKPLIPYILIAGSVFFLVIGYRIIKTKVDIDHLEDKSHLTEKIQKKARGGFYTGLMINLLNPTLFIGVLTSSFFVISLIAALGMNTGGLADRIDQHVKEISSIEGKKIESSKVLNIDKFNNIKIGRNETNVDNTVYPAYFHLVISSCYALFLSVGSIVWFYLLTILIVRFRQRISIKIITAFVMSLGFILCFFGLYFGYLGVNSFL